MTDKSFSNELQRALARSDAVELKKHLSTYHRYSGKGEEWPDEADAHMDAGMSAHWDDPDRALAYVVLSAASYDERDFLFLMAAGALEDLLNDPSPEMLNRIVGEARKTPRFRWMLTGVWLHAIAERARKPIEQAIDGWTEEMEAPQRPWA